MAPGSGIAIATSDAAELGREAKEQVAREFSEDVKSRAVVNCPKRTGNMARRHRVVRRGPGEYYVVVDTDYSLFVHEGHRIVVYGHDTGRRARPRRWLTKSVDEVMSRWQ